MSSGERAKQPGSYQERNPFDISKRSQTEVASEIAKRMAAWKKARGRAGATPADASEVPSLAEPKAPHLTAPVLPARMPKPAEGRRVAPEPAQAGRVEAQAGPRDAAPVDRQSRAPFFATFSIQRAMPPAPSPKASPETQAPSNQAPLNQPSTPSQPAIELEPAISADEAPAIVAPESGIQEAVVPDETPPAVAAETTPEQVEETAAADVAGEEPADPGAATLQQAADEAPHSVTAAQEPSPPGDEAEAAEALRAEARAIKARWMAAHDLEDAQAEPKIQERKAPAPVVTPAEALQDVSGRKEPTFDAPPVEAKSAEPRIQERKTPAPAVTPAEALQDVSGRKEPTFDAPPVEAKAAEPDSQEWPWTPPAIAAAFDEAHDDAAPVAKAKQADAATERPEPEPQSSLSIEALEAVSGRREPTLDVPVARKKSKARKASPQPAPQPGPPRATEPLQPKRRIELPTMQTRIEARRLNSMRADPQMAAHRPASQRSEPEAWEVMPPVPMSAQGGRHKTTWAIGLGAVLLLIGLTAPAAFLRHTGEQTPSVTGAITPEP
jgi:hypothetical protein